MADDFFEEKKRLVDPKETEATEQLKVFFDEHRKRVFFSRQVEVLHEEKYFHWITNRALRNLIAMRSLQTEQRRLASGGTIKLLWHRSYRYYRRSAADVVKLVEAYADPDIGAELGLHGERMVLEGFAEAQFIMRGRNTNTFQDKTWIESQHDLDFIFEKDGLAYGVEVKNTLRYMDYEEFQIKIRLCQQLGIRPLFVVRMIPRTWVRELVQAGGFALILKYQLYPSAHKPLAKQIARELQLPVDAPRRLAEGTMQRFLQWHVRNV